MSSKAEAALAIFQGRVGQEEGVGEWHTVDQKQIDLFADATLDHQFIHVDPEKAAELSPYKVTIAHGFLTLSMIVHLGASIPRADPAAYAGLTMGINYGLAHIHAVKTTLSNAVDQDNRVVDDNPGQADPVARELVSPRRPRKINRRTPARAPAEDPRRRPVLILITFVPADRGKL